MLPELVLVELSPKEKSPKAEESLVVMLPLFSAQAPSEFEPSVVVLLVDVLVMVEVHVACAFTPAKSQAIERKLVAILDFFIIFISLSRLTIWHG